MNHSIHFQSNIFQRKLIDIFFLIKLKTAVKYLYWKEFSVLSELLLNCIKDKATMKEPQCGNKKLTPIPFVLTIHNNAN